MRRLLGIAGLMLMWLFCGTSSAQPMGLAGAKVPTGVTGHGENVDTAKTVAFNKAVEEITGFMKRYEFTSFVVTDDYVRKHVLVDPGQPGEDVPVPGFAEPFKSWTLTFRTGYSNDLVRRDQEAQRKLRADERQTLGSHIVIGLAFLLLAGYGYVRLDEYTQRRYTTWLRVAGIGVAATVIAGWWWVYFQAPTAPMVPG